jgi:iron complex outermembrane receptor protein
MSRLATARRVVPLLVATCLASGAALSQVTPYTSSAASPDQPPPLGPEAAAAGNLAEGDIIVTARRTAENLQSTPVSVSAFNADTLRQASIQNTQDLLVKTPGVYLAGSGGRENTNFSIRGQSKALSGNSAPGVISYFAEVPAPTLGSSIPTYDLSSVQVLKGPQGTLFGRNTTGGAILYYPTAPTYKLGGYLEGSYGNYNDRHLDGALNVPIVDEHVALRIAGEYHKNDGYTKNIGVGRNLDDTNSRALRGSLLISPIDAIRNTTIVDYYRSRTAGGAAILTFVSTQPSALTQLGVQQAALQEYMRQLARGPRVTDSDADPFENVDRFGVTNRTEIDIAHDVQFVNIFGYRHTRLSYYASSDGLPTLTSDGTGVIPAGLPVDVVNGRQDSDINQITDEVQFKGKLFDNKLDWLVGAFYLDSKPVGPSGTYVAIFTLPGISDAPYSYNFYTEKSKAVFANVGYKLDSLVEGLRFDAGIRYTKDKITGCVGSGTTPTPDIGPSQCRNGAAGIIAPSNLHTSSSAPTWTIGLDWQANQKLFFYIVTRRGYREGGLNGPTLTGRLTPFQSFGPEKVTDVEAGVRSKFDVGGMAVRLNASPFIGWYSNVQVPITGLSTQAACSTTTPGGTDAPLSPDGNCDKADDPSGGTLLVNAGKTRIAGFDFDAEISPIRRLSLELSGTLLDTKSRSLTVPASLLPYLAIKSVPFNLVAKTTLSGSIHYDVPVPESFAHVVFNADIYHSSKVQVSDVFLPSYNLVNARLDFNGIAGTQFDASVFVRNLFNKNYLASGDVSALALGETSAFYGAPRTFGVQLRYRFGS